MQLIYKRKENEELSGRYDETPRRRIAHKIEYAALFLFGTALLVLAMLIPSQTMENIVGVVITVIALISAVYFLYVLILHIVLKADFTKSESEFAVKRFRICCAVYGCLIILTLIISAMVPLFTGGYSLADFLTMGCQFTAILCIGSIFFIEVNRDLED